MTPLLLQFIMQCAKDEADPDQVKAALDADPALMNEYRNVLTFLTDNAIVTLGGTVYRMPLIHPQMCEMLVKATEDYTFVPNYEEAEDYRINEVVVRENDLVLHEHLLNAVAPIINAYSLLLYSRPIKNFSSIQFARYTPDGTPGTGWHHDVTSDVSVVISLNPGEFEGGGTGIRTAAHDSFEMNPLPVGHAMFFGGKTVQHRGLPVTKGERLLLVFWCSFDEPSV